MTNTAAPIGVRFVHNVPCAIGPESAITPALNGGTLTIEQGQYAGDVVRLGTAYAPEPGTGAQWAHRDVVQRFEHPRHGVIIAAPINLRVLGDAPKLAAHQAAVTAHVTAAEKRISADDARLAELDRDA